MQTPDFFYYFFFLAQQPPVGQGLLIKEVSRSHTKTHHNRQDYSGRVISPSQRPLPDNTQHSQQTSMHPVGFKPTISLGERPHAHALDRAATGTGTNITTTHSNTEAAKCTSQRNHINFIFNHSIINCVYVFPNSVNIYRITNLT